MQLFLYKTLSSLSSCMLEAARAGEWKTVAAAEQGCRVIFDQLRALGAQPLRPSEAEAKRVILMKLLAEDREIRDLAQPWMRRLDPSDGRAE